MNCGIKSHPWDERNISYRGAIDAWECDQMQHMNIQFFAQRMCTAERYLFSVLGLSPGSLAKRGQALRSRAEYMVFKKEIRVGSPVLIEGVPVSLDSNRALKVEYRLYIARSGEVAAAMRADYALTDREGVEVPWPEQIPWPESLTRPLAADSAADSIGVEIAASDGVPLKECGRYAVAEDDCGSGEMRRDVLVRLINHAASHAGLERGRQWDDRGQLIVGSATLDIRLVRFSSIVPGTLIRVMSGLRLGTRKTFDVFHRVIDAMSGKTVADIRTTNVFFDVGRRKAISVPASMIEHLADAAPARAIP